MTSIRKLRTPTIAIVVLGAVVVILAALVVNQRIKDSGLSSQLRERRAELSAKSREAVIYRRTTGSYASLSSKLGVRYREASWGRQMPYVVNQLTGLAQSRGIRIDSIKPDTMTNANGIYRFPLRISFKAGIGDAAGLVRAIETAEPILDVEQLNLRAGGDASEPIEVDALVSSFAIVDEYAPEITEVKPAQQEEDSASVDSDSGVKSGEKASAQAGRERGAL